MADYYGVSFSKGAYKYRAQVKAAYLGSYTNQEEAAFAVNEHIIRMRLNLPLNDIPPIKVAIIKARRKAKLRETVMRVPRNYKKGPEDIIQEDIIKMLRLKGWTVRHLHGNMYQQGFPDLYAARKGVQRWIEVKNPKSWHFEESQLEFFHELAKQGVGVWILFGATELEYAKLFKPANFIFLTGIMK